MARKIVTIAVDRCGDCPNYSGLLHGEPSQCYAFEAQTHFTDESSTPPDWCPLPDEHPKEV